MLVQEALLSFIYILQDVKSSVNYHEHPTVKLAIG